MIKNEDITDIVMPAWIACWQNSNYGFQHTDPLNRTDMNDGRSLTRQRYDFVPSAVSVTMRVDSSHGAAFEAWYRDTLKNGALWFRARFMTPLSDDDELVVKFKGIYSGPDKNNAIRSKWDYKCSLEVFERPLWPDGWGNTPGLIAGAECLDRMMNTTLRVIP